MRSEVVLRRSLSQMPLRMEVDEGPADICGALVSVDRGSGRAVGIERIVEHAHL